MTDTAEGALESHGAFERAGDGFGVTTTPFDASVTVRGDTYRVTVRVPILDAVVEGEDVAPVVADGWFETFERRIDAVGGTTRTEPEPPIVDLDPDAGEVVVQFRFETSRPAIGADDAKALVDFVEGTYLLGVIPGYEYREPVAGLLQRAEARSEGEGVPPL